MVYFEREELAVVRNKQTCDNFADLIMQKRISCHQAEKNTLIKISDFIDSKLHEDNRKQLKTEKQNSNTEKDVGIEDSSAISDAGSHKSREWKPIKP